MAARKKQMVAVDDLVPPFKSGDWITATRKSSFQFSPYKSRKVWLAGCNPEYIGRRSCSSGWKYNEVDSGHFRKAAPCEIKAEIKRLARRIRVLEESKSILVGVLRDMGIEDR